MRARSLVLLVALLCACSPSEERAREQAHAALARGDRGAAIEAIEALRDAQREAPEALLEQADLLVRAGEAPRALWLLERAVAAFPERADLRTSLASAALLVGDPARAERLAREVPESSAQHAEAELVRARALILLGDLDAGLAAFRRAESARPDSAALRIPRLGALLEERRFGEARAALDEAYATFEAAEPRALLRSAELALLQYQASDALQRASERGADASARDAARADFEQALRGVQTLAERAPDDLAAWQLLTGLALGAGRVELAEPALKTALAEDATRVGLLPLLASCASARSDDAEAERLLRDFVALSPTAGAYVALARFLSVRQRADEGSEQLELALTEHPDDETLLFAHAELLLDAGRAEPAEEATRRLDALRPDAPQVELLRARLALARGDASSARARLERLAPTLDTAATQYWLARALAADGDRAGAAHRMRLAAVRDPAAPGPWLELLRLARQRGDWREAEQAGAAALQRAPRLIDGWQGVVDARIEQSEPAAALETARAAQALLGERRDTQLLLARALRANGQHAEAVALLDAATQRFGDAPELAVERVLALGLTGQVDAAQAEAVRARAAHGDSAAIHHALAGVLFQAGRAEEGAAEVERTLALAPDDPSPLAPSCLFHAATGRFEAAVRDCARYLELRPDDAAMLFALGLAQQESGRTADAVATYRRAAALDPRAAAPRNNLALLLAEEGDRGGALAAAQEAYALAPESAEVIDTLGWLYLEKGLVERAVSLLEDAHARAPLQDSAQLHLALAYRRAGREAEARRLLDALRARGADVDPALRAQLDAALAAH